MIEGLERGTAAHHGATAFRGAEGDTPRVPPLAALAGRLQREITQQRAQHHVHLHVGEGGADASPPAAAERDPLVGVGPAVGEAVRVEAARVGEQGFVEVIR